MTTSEKIIVTISIMLGGGKEKKISRLPPNSYVMVQYKTFDLKHYIVFVKKGPQPAKLLFENPHYRAKKKVVVNLSVENTKPMEK